MLGQAHGPRADRLAACALPIEEADPALPTVLVGVSVIECADKVALDELLAGGLQRFVVQRLSDTAAIVDHQQVAAVTQVLRKHGYPPKVTEH
jgi:hypothetical protein